MLSSSHKICIKHKKIIQTNYLFIFNGGVKESRTPDLLRARQALYQLSYGPKMVGLIRLELMTPALSTRCSNQLSYRPVFKHLTKEQLVVDSCQSDNFVKEVIQPQVPLRLPCYDFTPVIDPTVVIALLR